MKILGILFLVALFGYVVYALKRLRIDPPFSLLEAAAGEVDRRFLDEQLDNSEKQLDCYGYVYLKFNNETYSASRWRYVLLKDALILAPTFPFKWVFKPIRIPIERLYRGDKSRAFKFLPTWNFHIAGEERIALMIPRSVAKRLGHCINRFA